MQKELYNSHRTSINKSMLEPNSSLIVEQSVSKLKRNRTNIDEDGKMQIDQIIKSIRTSVDVGQIKTNHQPEMLEKAR